MRRGSSGEGEQRCKRFKVQTDGTHQHRLKDYKRQENLLTKVRNMIDRKGKKDTGVEDQALPLMTEMPNPIESRGKCTAWEEKRKSNMTTLLLERYGRCEEIIGRGASGVVRLSHKKVAKGTSTEHLYAVKKFRHDPRDSAKTHRKRFTSEFCIASRLQHLNIIGVLDLLQDGAGNYCEIMEYCAGGDLKTLVLREERLEASEADCYFKQLVRGVEYLHEMGVAHRDLKPDNLLLTTNGALKITDFGNADCFRLAWEKEGHLTLSHCGTIPYDAPEEYSHGEFDPRAVDVWATGVIYMVMRTGRLLWMVPRWKADQDFERYLNDRRTEIGYAPIERLSDVSPP